MLHSFQRTEKTIKPLIRHARTRILVIFGLLVTIVALDQPFWLIIIGLMTLIFAWWCGISLQTLINRFLLIVPFALGALLFLPFTTPGTSVYSVLGFSATAEGIEFAILLFLKIAVANFLLTYLLVTTPAFELLGELRKLGVPSLLIMMMQMILRYFVLLVEEMQAMLNAQKARGMRIRWMFWSSRTYQRIGELLGVLFIRAYVRSHYIYMAIASRGGLFDELQNEKSILVHAKGALTMVIQLKQISFSYGNQIVLQSIDFGLQRGSKTVLLGHNGAGKSTLISLLNGLSIPSSGELCLFGEKLTRHNRHMAKLKVGIVYQDPDNQIFSPTVEEDVAFGPQNLGMSEQAVKERVEYALSSLGIRELRNRSPFELSYGQKRRVAIAGVLAMQPEIIVMDEPSAFLDPKGRAELQTILESLHQTGVTLLIATHDIDFAAEWAEQVVILKEGSIYAHGSTDLLFDETILQGADLSLPRFVQPFRMIDELPSSIQPRTAQQAAQWIWRLMKKQKHYTTNVGERTATQSDK